MDIKTIPQGELEVLTTRLLQNLQSGAGEHKLARFRVDLANNPDQDELDALSCRGGMLSIDPDTKGKPFVKGQSDKEVRAVIAAMHQQGQPLYLLQYVFKKDGSDWAYETKAQSCDEYRQMCAERRPLEDAVEPILLAAAQTEMSDWKEIALTMDEIKKKLRVILRGPKGAWKDAVVTDEIRKAFEAIQAFYASLGFTLDSFNLEILGGPKKKVREVTDYYG